MADTSNWKYGFFLDHITKRTTTIIMSVSVISLFSTSVALVNRKIQRWHIWVVSSITTMKTLKEPRILFVYQLSQKRHSWMWHPYPLICSICYMNSLANTLKLKKLCSNYIWNENRIPLVSDLHLMVFILYL